MEQDKNTEPLVGEINQQLQYPLDHVTQEIIRDVVRNEIDIYSNDVHGRQVFTSDGTFTVPSGVRYVDVECVGGGGGGGCTDMASLIYRKSGGGGAYVRKIIDLDSVVTVDVTVGSGGTGGTCTNNTTTPGDVAGSDGEDTTFGSHLTGAKGLGNGSGGTAIGGDINIDGEDAWDNLLVTSASPYRTILSKAGSTIYGYGVGQVFVTSSGGLVRNGDNGSGYGSGGGCGYDFVVTPGSTEGVGGNGANGVCIITY